MEPVRPSTVIPGYTGFFVVAPLIAPPQRTGRLLQLERAFLLSAGLWMPALTRPRPLLAAVVPYALLPLRLQSTYIHKDSRSRKCYA